MNLYGFGVNKSSKTFSPSNHVWTRIFGKTSKLVKSPAPHVRPRGWPRTCPRSQFRGRAVLELRNGRSPILTAQLANKSPPYYVFIGLSKKVYSYLLLSAKQKCIKYFFVVSRAQSSITSSLNGAVKDRKVAVQWGFCTSNPTSQWKKLKMLKEFAWIERIHLLRDRFEDGSISQTNISEYFETAQKTIPKENPL